MGFITSAFNSINKDFLDGKTDRNGTPADGEFDAIFSKTLDQLDQTRDFQNQLKDLSPAAQTDIPNLFGSDSEIQTESFNSYFGISFDMNLALQKLEEARVSKQSLPTELAAKFTAIKNGQRLSTYQVNKTMKEFYGYSKAIITQLAGAKTPEEKAQNERRLNRTVYAQFLGIAYYGCTNCIQNLTEFLDDPKVPDSIKETIYEAFDHLAKQDKIQFKGLGFTPDTKEVAQKTREVKQALFDVAYARTDLQSIIDSLTGFTPSTDEPDSTASDETDPTSTASQDLTS